jgi:hypothetical protein
VLDGIPRCASRRLVRVVKTVMALRFKLGSWADVHTPLGTSSKTEPSPRRSPTQALGDSSTHARGQQTPLGFFMAVAMTCARKRRERRGDDAGDEDGIFWAPRASSSP